MIQYHKIHRSKYKILISTIISLIFLLFSSQQKNQNPSKLINKALSSRITQVPAEKFFIVTKVIDGDTIQLSNGEKVRYIGINTPEKDAECYSKEATDKNTELVLNKKIRLKKDISEKDKYGRLLRYVYVDDIFVNEFLVKEGYAHTATYPPDVSYSKWFKELEHKAREEKKGLWNKNICKNY